MDKIREFFAKKSIGFYVTIGSIVCAIVGFVLYLVTMKLQENMFASIVVISIIGILCGMVVCYKDFFRAVSIVSVMLYLLAAALFLVTQIDNIGYAITDTNIGDGIMPTFVAGMIMYGISVVAGVVAACLRQEKPIEK